MISRSVNKRNDKLYKVDSVKKPQRSVQALSGRIIDSKSLKPIIGTVLLSSLTLDFYYEYVQSDENGMFSFSNIPFIKNGHFLMQARKGHLDEVAFSKGNKSVQIEIDSQNVQKDLSHIQFDYLENIKEPSTGDSLFSLEYLTNPSAKNLEEVTITSSRINIRNNSNTIAVADRKDIIDVSSGISLLSALFPGKSFKHSNEDPTKIQVLIRTDDGYNYMDLSISVDGLIQMNHLFFEGFIADQIAYIGLYGSFLQVVTNPGYQKRSAANEGKEGILAYAFPQNMDQTDINYINRPDLWERAFFDDRKTIYWDPNFSFVGDYQKKINFTTSNIPGDYLIRISTIHPEYGLLFYEKEFKVIEAE